MEMKKKRIIVYGLGKMYWRARRHLENKYEIVGYSDSQKDKIIAGKIMPPEDIVRCSYDYICVTSIRYFDEIKEKLTKILGGGV